MSDSVLSRPVSRAENLLRRVTTLGRVVRTEEVTLNREACLSPECYSCTPSHVAPVAVYAVTLVQQEVYPGGLPWATLHYPVHPPCTTLPYVHPATLPSYPAQSTHSWSRTVTKWSFWTFWPDYPCRRRCSGTSREPRITRESEN